MKKNATRTLFGALDEPADTRGWRIIRVAVDTGADREFDYLLPEELGPVEIGQRIEAPFGKKNKPVAAFCVELLTSPEAIARARRFKLKAVKKILDEKPLLDTHLMGLARWISEYYICPLGQVLSAMVPMAVKQGAGLRKKQFVFLDSDYLQKPTKSSKQQNVIKILEEAGANGRDSAIEKDVLLHQAQCTDAPLKQIIRCGAAVVFMLERIAALPAIPKDFYFTSEKIVLNQDQKRAIAHLEGQLQSGSFGVTLLFGVTDSGKTEVYIRAIEKALTLGKQAIVLLPEIALTAQTVERFSSRFKNIAVLHSALSGPQRNAQWQMIKQGRADVVIGARSAVFAPLQRLGLIIADEEHEASYKQDTAPRYHARDVAVKRAQMAGACCLLGSATPSLESLLNCSNKPFYTLVKMPRRVRDFPMPEMKLVDMTAAFPGGGLKHPGLLSPLLTEHLQKILRRKEQAILLLNRRGYSNFIFCPSCRHSLHCPNCDVTLTFHKKGSAEKACDTVLGKPMEGGYAICHYCLCKTLVPRQCPLCRTRMTMIGLGSQKLEEELSIRFPDARIRRVDSDSMVGRDYYSVLDDFARGQIDILAGTQMLAKGLHFPNVTLVGIISADTALSLPDFRANERTFQLISQVAGRAGRSEKPGTVIVQTYLPNSPAIGYAVGYDYNGFVQEELKHRKSCLLPPFGKMAIIRMRSNRYERLENAAKVMRARCDDTINRLGLQIKIRGPMPSAISRIQRFHRMQIIVQSPEALSLQKFLAEMRTQPPPGSAVGVQIDVDPVNVL